MRENESGLARGTAQAAVKPHAATIPPATHVTGTVCAAPAELRSLKAWLIWRYDVALDEEKPRKVPYYARGGKRHGQQGSPDDRAALVTFDEAATARAGRGFTGVGIAMLSDWGLVGLAFDHCVDAAR